MSEQEIVEKSTYLTADQLSKISGRSKEELLLILSRNLERDREIQALSMSGVSSRLTPKEKAWQLWNYYGTLFGRYDKASEAAIRCVDEIHEFMRNDDDESDTCYWANHKNSNYWCDVAVELRKLS